MTHEFPLYGVNCVICGRPGVAFVPDVGVKHMSGWCRFPAADRSLRTLLRAELAASSTGLARSA
ncbi:hypothetical protein IRT45_09300 [Nocardia sp. BSTN01]|uniref:hypothetical protein n=1 Tax=Nocardia sp. BSTN01 TaxID=2783665 RepID=UPI0018902849|nr:hypothetical protein [Nocardia sp. BSTN01]MBF4997353.1 hypothetical protein [Nocardia sp. BSTN01]